MPLFAHAGHILIDGPLFLGPILLIGGALWVSTKREQKRRRESDKPSRG